MITELKGWSKQPPQFIFDAIAKGELKVTYSKKDDFDYLFGKVVNLDGMVIEFK